MLKLFFRGNSDQRLVESLRAKGPNIVRILMTKVNSLMIQLQSYIVAEKLSGQYLKRRTGKLAGSIRFIPATLEGTKIIGAVEGAGSASWYGKLYEYETAGGTGGVPHSWEIVATNARALNFVMSGRDVFVKSVTHPGLALRPFMTDSLNENADRIAGELQAAIDEEINQP